MKDRRIEREVDQIRLEIYEEIKDLTHKQYNERVRKVGEAAAKKYGFQRVTNTKENKILLTQER